jgi:hypothetical protein
MKNRVILVSLLAWVCCFLTRAEVITGNAAFVTNGPSSVLLVASTTRESHLGPQISDLGNGDYEFSIGLIAMAYYTYLSSFGSEFTQSSAEDWPNALDTGFNTVTFSVNETKYFAFWADVFGSPTEDGPDSDDDYGWVALTYTGTDLVITDSATALGGGIIVGTYTQIPEPATILLLGLGGIGAWLLRRNKRPVSEV